LRFYQVYLSSAGISRPKSCRLAQRQRAFVENVFDNTAAEHGECTLSYSFTDGRRNHRSDGLLSFPVLAACGLSMLQESGYQRPFLSTENPFVPHQCF
jgi:hypothetical protein